LSEYSGERPAPKHDPLAALRQPRFILYTLSRLFSMTGQAMLQAILAWHVYDLTGSALSLGFLGLARFLPSLGMSMIGGAVADSYNRRNIIMVAQCVPLTCGVILAFGTLSGWVTAEIIYGLVLLLGLAAAFEGPARVALLPAIVRTETFANAVTVSSTLQTLGMASGPVLGTAVIAVVDVGSAYVVYSCFLVVAVITLSFLRYEQTALSRRNVSVEGIKEGVQFVWRRPVLLGAMSLDMFAVIFGGAKGLLPVYAKDILHAGAVGYGLLFASLEIGAFLMSAILVLRPPIYRTGRALVYSVALFGLLTVAFGLSRNIYLSIAIYMAIGAADQISVVMRNVIIQLATPDELRGRVSSVGQVFIGASNQLGAMESGFVAAVTNATFAVVSGGVAAVAVAAAIGWRVRALLDHTTAAHAGTAWTKQPERVEEPVPASWGGS
jgi:MFS family permease